MKRLLIKLKFSYKKSNDGRKFLMERNDIVALRCKFLRTMCTLRKNNDPRPVVYLDETWVNQNHSRSHIWQNEENTEGFKVPTGKGGRLIVWFKITWIYRRGKNDFSEQIRQYRRLP